MSDSKENCPESKGAEVGNQSQEEGKTKLKVSTGGLRSRYSVR